MNFEEIVATINQSNDFIIHERELFAVVTSEGQYSSTPRVGLSTVYQRWKALERFLPLAVFVRLLIREFIYIQKFILKWFAKSTYDLNFEVTALAQ